MRTQINISKAVLVCCLVSSALICLVMVRGRSMLRDTVTSERAAGSSSPLLLNIRQYDTDKYGTEREKENVKQDRLFDSVDSESQYLVRPSAHVGLQVERRRDATSGELQDDHALQLQALPAATAEELPQKARKADRWQRWRRACLKPFRTIEQAQETQAACQRWALAKWPGNGVLIYTCTGKRNEKCGGLADRARGMLLTYWLSVVRRTAFFIDSRRPTDRALETFWLPAETLNWTLPASQRSSGDHMRYVICMPSDAKSRLTSRLVKDVQTTDELLQDMNDQQLPHFDRNVDNKCECMQNYLARKDTEGKKVVRFSTTHHHSCVVNMFRKLNMTFSRQVWTSTFGYLFKPSPFLRSLSRAFSDATAWHPSSSVCIHLRAGGPVGPEGYQVADNYRTDLQVRQKMYQCARRFSDQSLRTSLHSGLANIQKPSAYLVVADHRELIPEAQKHVGKTQVLSTESFGPMLHIDKTDFSLASSPELYSQMEMGEERAYLDHFLLSQCQYAVVDTSGFAWTALNFSERSRAVIRPSVDSSVCQEADETERL
eukprot:scpid41521/ scgid19371/ 